MPCRPPWSGWTHRCMIAISGELALALSAVIMQCFACRACSVLCHAESPSQHACPFVVREVRSSH
eukprot:11363154-Prorocentrum_lima.AAC.1